MSTNTIGSQMRSDSRVRTHANVPDVRDRLATEAWLETRSQDLADEMATVIRKTLLRTYDEFLISVEMTTLSAAGDPSVFDRIPITWNELTAETVNPFLQETFLQGGVSAFMAAPGAPRMTQKQLKDWIKVVNAEADDYLVEANNRLIGVGNVLWNTVRNEAVQAMRTGEGVEALKERIERVTKFSEFRADTIARTETIGAFNNGDWIAQQALGEFGPVEKVWVATGDARTRPEHLEVDGVVVPIDEPFDVGGESMMYPHDDSASAANVVNCRCYAEYLYVGDTRPDGSIVELDPAVSNELPPDAGYDVEMEIECNSPCEITGDLTEGPSDRPDDFSQQEQSDLRTSINMGTRLTRAEEHQWLDYQADGYRLTNLDVVEIREAAKSLGITYDDAIKRGMGRERAKPMESAWRKRSTESPRDVVLYRGTSGDAPLRALEVGQVIQPRGFMSTSSSQTIAQAFVDGKGQGFGFLQEVRLPTHRRLMRVNVRQGTRIAPARADEAEWLLHHSTELRVTRIQMRPDGVELVDVEVIR